MSEYREELQSIMDVIDYQDVHLTPAYSNAKALLARGEPQCVEGLNGREEMLYLKDKAHKLAITNDDRRSFKLPSKQLMMEPEQFLAFVSYCESLEPAAPLPSPPAATAPCEECGGSGGVVYSFYPYLSLTFPSCNRHESPPAATGEK